MDVVPVVDEGLGNSAYVVETHLHADFVSGGRELVGAGAQPLAPAGSDLAFGHRPLRDGDEVELGGLTLEVIATPGHTPEHLAYLPRDGSRPVALFSGGTLMAGGVARADLLSAEQTEPLARAAYRSIHQRLLTLPDELAVYPTHGGGSFCSVADGAEVVDVRQIGAFAAGHVPGALSNPWRGQFASWLGWLVDRTRPVVDAAGADGGRPLDIRQQPEFASGHAPGALHVELGALQTGGEA